MNTEVQKFGKILYVEPNDFLTEELYNESGNSYNTTLPYEDYNISVDLIVRIPDRMGNATYRNYTIPVSNKNHTEVKKTSFFGGTNGFITDLPGSTTYKDIINKETEGVNENLGISSIHITYNSYFYPEVVINFSDIRGSSLFMPNEEIYRQEQIGESSDVSNFFSSLFTFPYPEFKLQVKGFYGNKVEYSLLVSDFKSNFNSQTGNFDATVRFIGKMYGIYSDIPMIYLLIAPYCKYGCTNNNTIWEESGFEIEEGVKMKTFLELKKSILDCNNNLDKLMDYNTSQDYKNICGKLNILQSLKNNLNQLIKVKKELEGFKIYHNFNGGILLFYKPTAFNMDYKDDNNLLTEINSLINEFNINNHEKLPNLPSPIENEKYLKTFFKKNKDSKNIYYFGKNKIEIEPLVGEYIKEEINKFLKVSNIFRADFYEIDLDDINNNIEKYITSYNKKLLTIEDELSRNMNQNIKNLIGFTPTIGNIFKMLMAHLQCFLKIYNNFISNVTNDNIRNLQTHHSFSTFETDIPLNNQYIPPFPGIKDINKNEFIYPDWDKEMEEVKFIESLFDGVNSFLDEKKLINEIEKNSNIEQNKFIPSCLTDIVTNINPYTNVFKHADNNEYIDLLATCFGSRCISSFMFENNVKTKDDIEKEEENTKKIEEKKKEEDKEKEVKELEEKNKSSKLEAIEFGYCEAYNFWRANPGLSKDILSKIKSGFYSDYFINYLTEEKAHCYSQNSSSYNLLINDDDNAMLKLNTKFNFPAVFDKDDNGILSFKNVILNDKYGEFSFSEQYRPYGFIQFINDEYIDKLNKEIESVEIINDTGNIKPRLITNKIKKSKDFFKTDILKSNVYFYNINDNIEISSYEIIDNQKKYLKKLISINDFFNEKKGNLIHLNNNETPFFLDEDLTPFKFLSAFPYDLKKILEIISKGRCIAEIPYILLLYIGMLMDIIFNGSDDDFETIKKLNLNNNFYISLIVSYFTRNKYGGIHPNYHDYDMTYLRDMGKEGSGYIDTLKLIYIYKNWAEGDGDTPGTFNYIRKHYILKNTKNGNILSKKDIIEIGDKNEKIQKLNICTSAITNNSSKTPFSERYSGIYTDKKGKYMYLFLNDKFIAYKDLNDLFKTVKIVFPYSSSNNSCDKKYFITAFDAFRTSLLKYYNIDPYSNKNEIEENPNISTESKLSMYMTLKNLYDKHLHELPSMIDFFDIEKNDGEFSKFHFIDSFYNDLKDDLILNIESIVNCLNKISEGYNGGINATNINISELSVYSFMSLLCQEHNMMLISMPFFNGSMKGNDLKEMFTPKIDSEILSSPSYICFYPHKPSQHLDIPNSQYKNDGFNINSDLNDTQNFEGNIPLSHLNNNKSINIPAFGVEFGSQKQSIFKDIQVNMDNPQTTEVAVATQFNIANNAKGLREVTFNGQDLYRIYTNYSFTCNVNMMGCAQIQPLMYFQLNNIPMFRGAYQIIKVEHEITPGDMKTSFTGVRINRTKTPLVKTCINLNNVKNYIDNNVDNIKNITNSSTSNNNSNITLNVDVNRSHSQELNVSNSDKYYDYDMFKNLGNINFSNPLGSYVTGKAEDGFNQLSTTFRKILYNICERIKEEFASLMVEFNSSTRTMGINSKIISPKSDHSIPYTINTTPSNRRKELNEYRTTLPIYKVNNIDTLIHKEKHYNWDGNKYVEKITRDALNETVNESICDVREIQNTLDLTGCAIDITTKDRTKPLIKIFELIALEYTDCIRQLLWEVDDDVASSQNSISNCVHFASYGVGENNDKCEIFVSKKEGKKWGCVNVTYINGIPSNLPSEFIRVLYELSKNKNKYDNVSLPNFPKKPTNEQLKSWYETMTKKTLS